MCVGTCVRQGVQRDGLNRGSSPNLPTQSEGSGGSDSQQGTGDKSRGG